MKLSLEKKNKTRKDVISFFPYLYSSQSLDAASRMMEYMGVLLFSVIDALIFL